MSTGKDWKKRPSLVASSQDTPHSHGEKSPRFDLAPVEKNQFFSTGARSNLGVARGQSYIFGDCVCKVKHNSPNPKDIGAAKM